MAVTRAFIRRIVGRMSRQMLVAKATASGTTTTLVDVVRLADPSSTLQGRIGWVSGGTAGNLYSTIRVTDNDRSASSITFVPALSQSTAINDEVELWNEQDQGVLPEEVHEFINFGIEAVADNFPILAIDTEATFDRDSPVLSIPESWKWIEGADWQDVRGLWHPIPQKDLRVDEVNRTIEPLAIAAVNANRLQVRLRGATRPAALSLDTSTTPLPAEYLAKYVAYHVLLSASYPNMAGVQLERWANTYKEEAEAIRLTARARPQGLGIALP